MILSDKRETKRRKLHRKEYLGIYVYTTSCMDDFYRFPI